MPVRIWQRASASVRPCQNENLPIVFAGDFNFDVAALYERVNSILIDPRCSVFRASHVRKRGAFEPRESLREKFRVFWCVPSFALRLARFGKLSSSTRRSECGIDCCAACESVAALALQLRAPGNNICGSIAQTRKHGGFFKLKPPLDPLARAF